MAILEFEKVSFLFPDSKTNALSDVSFSVKEGEFVLLCGPSGGGKTTLLRCLKTAVRPVGKMTGNILVDGMSISSLSPRREATLVGYVGQNPERTCFSDTVFGEVAFGPERIGEPGDRIPALVAETLGFLGIGDLADRKIDTLSGGQKQLVSLASVLVLKPRILLLDEPTSRLDPSSSLRFLSVLQKLNSETGMTVILSEHCVSDWIPLCDRICFLEGGRLTSVVSPRDIGNGLPGLEKDASFVSFLPLPTRVALEFQENREESIPLSVREGREWLAGRVYGGSDTNEKEPSERGRERKEENEILSLDELWFRYGKGEPDVLCGLSLSISSGEVLAVLGGNGVGKSTLLKLAVGILRPLSGKIKYKGKKVGSAGENRGIAYLPQDPTLLFSFDTVLEELRETAGGDEKRIREVVERLSLSSLTESHPSDLSGGESERVALAKLLLLKPDILFLDEPTSGLDPLAKAELGKELRNLSGEGMAIVVVTHDLDFAGDYADRCALFSNGRIVSYSDCETFFLSNSFYTTETVRLTRGIVSGCYHPDDLFAKMKMVSDEGKGGAGD